MGWSFRKHTPDSWEKAVAAYFENTPAEDWRIPDLCIKTGITTSTFQRYLNAPGFEETCRMARDMVNNKREAMVEKGQGYGNGILFLLRVNGYQDTQYIQQDMNVKGTVTVEQFLLDEDEEIQA